MTTDEARKIRWVEGDKSYSYRDYFTCPWCAVLTDEGHFVDDELVCKDCGDLVYG